MTQFHHRLALLLSLLLLSNIPPALGQTKARPGAAKKTSEQDKKPAPTPEKEQNPAPPTGVRFDSGGRRDPFLNLLALKKKSEVKDEVIVEAPTVLPPGIAGMRIAEIVLKGTSERESGFTAVIRGNDKRTYFLREGDRLYDGFVKKIERDSVVFVQETKMRSGKVTTQEIPKRLRAN